MEGALSRSRVGDDEGVGVEHVIQGDAQRSAIGDDQMIDFDGILRVGEIFVSDVHRPGIQTGTLFVYANSNTWAVDIGNEDFSDAQNSIKIDHLIVTNSGPLGVALNYVLNADAFIVADAGPGQGTLHVGLGLTQVQFSTLRGAASTVDGWAMWLGGGYNIANTIQGFDFEGSQWCLVNTSPSSASNTFVSPYLNCLGGVNSASGSGNVLLNPLFGGATQIPTAITAGFKVMQ